MRTVAMLIYQFYIYRDTETQGDTERNRETQGVTERHIETHRDT